MRKEELDELKKRLDELQGERLYPLIGSVVRKNKK